MKIHALWSLLMLTDSYLNDSKMFIYDSNTSKKMNYGLNSSLHTHITINLFLGNNEANYHKKNNVYRYSSVTEKCWRTFYTTLIINYLKIHFW